jgi:hypothetical protein
LPRGRCRLTEAKNIRALGRQVACFAQRLYSAAGLKIRVDLDQWLWPKLLGVVLGIHKGAYVIGFYARETACEV